MALGATGAMRMGADVNVELGSASTTQISLGQASVRTLTGIESGAVMFPTNFYGKSNAPTVGLFYGGYILSGFTQSNALTRINACGALVGSETNAGTARCSLAGAPVGSYALYYAGRCSPGATGVTKSVTRFASCGSLVGTSSASGSTARTNVSGAKVGSNGLFYGGFVTCITYGYQIVNNSTTRINACGGQVGSCASVGTARSKTAGAPVGSNGLFYSGYSGTAFNNIVTRINACGALVGSETNAGNNCRYTCGLGGAKVGSNGLFFAGDFAASGNLVTRINACGTLVGSETYVGTSRAGLGGHQVGSNGLFFGGTAVCGRKAADTNKVTRINACGALVGSETTAGTARHYLAGAGL